MKLSKIEEQKLKQIGKKYKLKMIVLHGSYATGKVKPDSDLDIAILGNKPFDYKTVGNIYMDLEKVFASSFKGELDVKSLHRIDPLFRYHVAKDSQLIYGNMTDYNEFRAYAFRLYFDSGDLFKLENILVSRYQDHLNEKYLKKYA
ncbi:MAG: nucleotidyltransferase domain-containing protein [Actinobacteria bacterium]|nr:nucleotidyltransferase domain-containing protein [Actinomycetota bacterium]